MKNEEVALIIILLIVVIIAVSVLSLASADTNPKNLTVNPAQITQPAQKAKIDITGIICFLLLTLLTVSTYTLGKISATRNGENLSGYVANSTVLASKPPSNHNAINFYGIIIIIIALIAIFFGIRSLIKRGDLCCIKMVDHFAVAHKRGQQAKCKTSDNNCCIVTCSWSYKTFYTISGVISLFLLYLISLRDPFLYRILITIVLLIIIITIVIIVKKISCKKLKEILKILKDPDSPADPNTSTNPDPPTNSNALA